MAEMSEARMLVAELEALLAAVHADDPKREILVRVGDAIREAKGLGAWQTIDTAPTNGDHVLVSEDGIVSEAYYEAERGVWCLANTHWTDATRSEIWPQFWQSMPAGRNA